MYRKMLQREKKTLMNRLIVSCALSMSLSGMCSDQIIPLGEFDRFILQDVLTIAQIQKMKEDIETGKTTGILYGMSLQRGDRSALGKAVFKKLHTIKNKSNLMSATFGYALLTAKDGSLKDAKNFELSLFVENKIVLHTALQKIMDETSQKNNKDG